MMKQESNYQDRIILALDVRGEKEAIDLINRLENQVKYVKVGMELFYATGFLFIEKLKKLGLRIFLDLKMHDIPNTVAKAAVQLTRLEVDMFNMHVAGGLFMMNQARENVEKALVSGQKKPLLIGVTQLTSTDDKMLKEEIGIPLSVEDTVMHYAKLAQSAGLDGVVSSPLEVQKVKITCGKSFKTITPGIRFKNSDEHDQKRITTPKEAFMLGSDYIVIGRAITEAKEPAKLFKEIIHELQILD